MTEGCGLATDRLYRGDCIEGLARVKDGSIDLAFADPPFNIGYEYDVYDDRREADCYLAWTHRWAREVVRVLKPDGTFWLAIGDEFAAELKLIFHRELGLTPRSWVVWYYTFGVNCTRKFNRSHAHLLYFVKDPRRFTFNFNDPEIRVPSARQLVYADKRAHPRGRLPDDTWILRPQDVPHGSLYVAIGDEYAAEVKVRLDALGLTLRNWIVWHYTFGVHCTRKFTRSHAHIFYYVADPKRFTFNADAVRVPSARQTTYADRRANPSGKLPDDTWVLRPQEDARFFPADSDTWYVSRVCGTFKERTGHPCQMPEGVLERIVRASSNPGDLVLDPFAGSGTTLAVAKRLGRRYLGVELSSAYAECVRERLANVQPERLPAGQSAG